MCCDLGMQDIIGYYQLTAFSHILAYELKSAAGTQFGRTGCFYFVEKTLFKKGENSFVVIFFLIHLFKWLRTERKTSGCTMLLVSN